MMIKILVATKLDMSISRMIIAVVQGRSNKAARLHSVDESAAPEFVGIRGNVQQEKGGDRWLSRGYKGMWQRLHSTPRNSLFTPFNQQGS